MTTQELEPLINLGSHSIKTGTLVKSNVIGEYLGLSSYFQSTIIQSKEILLLSLEDFFFNVPAD